MFKKIFVGIALVASFNIVPLYALADHNTAHTIQQLQEQINAILARIQSLQSSTTTPFCHTFNTSLRVGDTGPEVNALLTALQKEGFSSSDILPSAQGTIVGSFGQGTVAAVISFQEKYRSEILTPNGLQSGTGFVGISTRAKLNQLYGCVPPLPTVNTPPPPTTTTTAPPTTTTTPPPTTTSTVSQFPTEITILYPNGGESIALSDRINIVWSTTGSITKVDLALYKDGNFVGTIVTGMPNSGSYTWTPSSLVSSNSAGNNVFKIYATGTKINGGTANDFSDSNFSILAPTSVVSPIPIPTPTATTTTTTTNPPTPTTPPPPTPMPLITVMSPNGGESLGLNSPYNITWSGGSDIPTIDHFALYKNDQFVGVIATNIPNSGSYTWTPSNLVASSNTGNNVFKILIRGIKSDGAIVQDFSNAVFSIVAPTSTTPPPPVLDTTPPVISNGQPSGTISAPTTPTVDVTLRVTTNEPAICRFSYLRNQSYDDMNFPANQMEPAFTPGTSHSKTLSGLGAGVSWTYYVKCADSAGWVAGTHYAAQDNKNTSDYPITFTIPSVVPTVSSGHRYLKVKSKSNSWLAWHEIQVYDSSGILTPTNCTASGNYPSSSTLCESTYPGRSGYWNAGNYSGEIILDFGSNKNITQVKLLPSSDPILATATHELLVMPHNGNFTSLKIFSGQFPDQQWIVYSSPTSQSVGPMFASVIYAMMETLNSISKQLNLLK